MAVIDPAFASARTAGVSQREACVPVTTREEDDFALGGGTCVFNFKTCARFTVY